MRHPDTPYVPEITKTLSAIWSDLKAKTQGEPIEVKMCIRDSLGDARDLEHDPARLDYRDPVLGRTLTGTHTGLGGLRSEDVYKRQV